MSNPKPGTVSPFPTDIDYVLAEFSWIKARCKRIGAERTMREAEESREQRGVIGRIERTSSKEMSRRLPALRAAEDDLRREIDQRLAINRADGPELGIDAICRQRMLGSFERAVLILGTLVAVGTAETDFLDDVTIRGCYSGTLSPETVGAFLELDLAARIQSRLAFLPTAPLLAGGLITLCIGVVSSPANLPSSHIEITAPTFARIVGLPELEAEGKHQGMEI